MNLDFLNDDDAFDVTPQAPSKYKTMSTNTYAQQATDELKDAIPPETHLEEAKMAIVPAPRRMQGTVNAIVNNDVYQSLEVSIQTGEMTDVQRMECVRVLGFAPPDLKSPNCQRQLIARNPVLEAAFENPVISSFVTGVNASAQDLCCNMMVASLNLSGLDECLQLMGRNAEGRGKIVECAMQISRGFHEVGKQTDAFGLCMARIIREVSGAATALKYGADESTVLESLKTIGNIVSSQRQNFEESASAVRTPVEEVLRYIKENMVKADKTFQQREANVENLRLKWEAKWKEKKEIADGVRAQQVTLETQIRAEKVERSVISRQIERLSSELEELQERKRRLEERMTTFDIQCDEVKKNIHCEEVKTDADIHREAQAWIKEEICMQERSLDARIKELTQQANSLASQSAKFENESITATDGMDSVTRTTSHRTGVFGWYRSTLRENHLEQVRPNEKERLVRLAGSTAEKKAEIDRQIERLLQEKRSVRVDIKRALQEQAQQNREKQLTSIETQTAYLTGLLDGIVQKMNSVQDRLTVEQPKLEVVQNTLVAMQQKYHLIDETALLAKTNEEQSAKQRYDDAKKALEEHMQRMDVTDGNDFASLLTLLSGLNASIDALPRAIDKLEGSYRAAYEAFNGNLFASIAETIPPENRRKYLEDVIGQLLAVCEMSWSLMQAPVRTMTLNRAIAYQKFRGSLSSVVIEEAD